MLTYKYCLYSMFDIAGTQRWLERQSEKGLHIETAFNGRIVGFLRGEPKKIRYRFDAAPDVDSWGVERGTPAPDQQTYEAYREMGWEYVSNRNHFHIYAAENPAAAELHTDPRVQAMSLELVRRRTRRIFLWTIPLVVLWVLRLTVFSNPYRDIYRPLIEGQAIFPLIALLAYAALFLKELWEYLCVRTAQKDLSRDGVLRPFSRKRRIVTFCLELLFLAAFVLMFTVYSPSAREQAEEIPLSEYTEALSLPTADQILAGTTFTVTDSTVRTWESPAAPANIQLQQSVVLEHSDGKKLTGSWYVTRHDTAVPWIAERYAKEDLTQYPDRWTVEELPLETKLDDSRAYRVTYPGWTGPDSPTIVLRSGSTVLFASLDFQGRAEPVDYRVIAQILTGYLE